MTTSRIHQTCLDFERQIFAIVGPGLPTTYAPNANTGSQYTDASTGNLYLMIGGTWTLVGAAGGSGTSWATITGTPTTLAGYGITDAYSKSTSDGRYLQLSGGMLTGDITTSGVIRSISTNGWAIGNVAGVPRMQYGAAAAGAFSLLNASNGYADLYLANIVATSVALAQNSAVYWPVGGGGWYMSDTTFMRVTGNKMIYASGGILLDPGIGLQSNVSGSATLAFAPSAPGYLDFHSGDTTVGAFRMYRNGSIAGYLYAANYSPTESYFGLLNNAGNWMLQLNPNSIGGGTLFSTWTHAARAIFNEYAQFSVPSVSFTSGYIGAAQVASSLINGSAQGDLCFRAENKTMWWSVNAGTSAMMALDGNGLHVYKAIDISYPGATSTAPVAGVVVASAPPTSSDLYPPNTIWLVT